MRPARRLSELARRLHWIERGRIALVPGLSTESAGEAGGEGGGVPDVMRGEEVQILGALRLTGLTDGLFVLPGTHNKWATVHAGRVTGFRTCMTGEVYGLLAQHSILARTLEADAPLDEAAFRDGLARAGNGQGLLHNLFGVRALALFDRLTPAASPSYLSGVLIGEELRTQPLAEVREVVLIGTPALTARYTLALSALGVKTRALGNEATWAGLWAVKMAMKTVRGTVTGAVT